MWHLFNSMIWKSETLYTHNGPPTKAQAENTNVLDANEWMLCNHLFWTAQRVHGVYKTTELYVKYAKYSISVKIARFKVYGLLHNNYVTLPYVFQIVSKNIYQYFNIVIFRIAVGIPFFQTAVFTLLLRILLPGDHITRIYLYLL